MTLAVRSPLEKIGPGQIRFFPNAADFSSRLVPADIELLMTGPSALYARLQDGGARALSLRARVGEKAARVLAREAMVLLTFFFLDRLLRLDRLVKRLGPGLAAEAPGNFEIPKDLPGFMGAAASSAAFNRFATALLAPIWDLPISPSQAEPAAAKRPHPSSQNLNFEGMTFWRRARWKTIRTLSRLWGRIPALSLAYAHSHLQNAWIFGPGRLCDLRAGLPPAAAPMDQALRREFIEDAVAAAEEELLAWLDKAGLAPEKRGKILERFKEFLRLCYPATHLEQAAAHQAFCAGRLKSFAPRPLVISETVDPYVSHMIAAAKDLGMPVIGIQHAAPYSFFDTPAYYELEVAHCDRYITWGQTEAPAPGRADLQAVALPSPWMSQRARSWKNRAPAAKNPEYDVLLMTDKFQRFPPTLSTNRHFRLDYLPEYAATLSEMVQGLTRAQITVLHKPFDPISLEAVSETVVELEKKSGGRYAVHAGMDKGLTKELVDRCGLVLWDEPGSGFIECLAGGIPAMLYWPQIAAQPSPRARELFSELEAAGLFHRTLKPALKELLAFKADPAGWMNEPRRKEAIARVLRRNFWVDDRWPEAWRRYVSSLR